jgi:hypothetical protein
MQMGHRDHAPIAIAFFAALAGCGPDPCDEPASAPRIELGGAPDDGSSFVAFEDGAERSLVYGLQGGMHVWLQARVHGLCPRDTVLERRVVDDATDRVPTFSSGPIALVDSEIEGAFELPTAIQMIVCPSSELPVVGQRLRFVASATDGAMRHAESEIAFVAACPSGFDCGAICNR